MLATSNAGAIAGGCLAVVTIFVVMVIAAVTWSKHGMLPTRGPFAGLGAQISFVRRRLERMNRQFGWGDMAARTMPNGARARPSRS